MKYTIDLPDGLTKQVKIYKANNELPNLNNAIIHILLDYFSKKK
jgi:hypothetical protein